MKWLSVFPEQTPLHRHDFDERRGTKGEQGAAGQPLGLLCRRCFPQLSPFSFAPCTGPGTSSERSTIQNSPPTFSFSAQPFYPCSVCWLYPSSLGIFCEPRQSTHVSFRSSLSDWPLSPYPIWRLWNASAFRGGANRKKTVFARLEAIFLSGLGSEDGPTARAFAHATGMVRVKLAGFAFERVGL